MVLKLVRSPKGKHGHFVDIIAIPAIGADPEVTWRYPQGRAPHPQYIWNDVKEACVYLYKFDRPAGQQEYSLVQYGKALLEELAASKGIGNCAIHFAAHSTGGIALKQALVLSLSTLGEQQPRYVQIRKSCLSIAFFGTPHEGSSILSGTVYKDSVKDALLLDKPLGKDLRKEFEMNSVVLNGLSRYFQPLTLSMKKIWSFYEFRESYLRVKVAASGATGMKITTSTEVKSAIVDKRSAVMSDEGFLIGCEEAIPVNATHAMLPEFGDNPYSTEFSNYIDALDILVQCTSTERSLENEENCRVLIEGEVSAEVHQFYDVSRSGDAEAVRLWSVNPSLHELFEHGPGWFLSRRSECAKLDVGHIKESTARPEAGLSAQGLIADIITEAEDASAVTNQRNEKRSIQQPSSPATDSFPSASEDSRANNMSWVENTLQSIDREVALRQKNEAESLSTLASDESASITGSPTSEPALLPSDIFESENANPALSQLLKGAVVLQEQKEDSTVTDLLVKAVQDPAQAVKLLEVAQVGDPRHPTQSFELPSIVADIREQASMLKTAAQMQRRKEDGSTDVTSGNLLAALNNAARKAGPPLVSTLLHPKYWNLSQSKTNHDRPHGRFMMPGFHSFYPKSHYTKDPDCEHYLYSASDTAQFVLYFPYLHWDTFGCMKSRNDLVDKLVKQRCEHGLDLKPSIEAMQNLTTEKKLICQYLFNSAELPLHIRRTLDQFGYPNLENTKERDLDQVVFKWAKDANDRLRRKQGNKAQLQTLPSIGLNMLKDEDDLKVLMIDQLWCWIVNDDNVATFFPAKEENSSPDRTEDGGNPKTSSQSSRTEDRKTAISKVHPSHRPPSKAVLSPADLRDELYDELNGDPDFQKIDETQCHDPLDFMARAVWHAVTLFLDTGPGTVSQQPDLRIFQVYEARICDLREKLAKAFKILKNTERRHKRDLALTDSGIAARNLQEAVKELDNSEDLSNLLEAHDVIDELHILAKLFNQQLEVIAKMIRSYHKTDELTKEDKHTRAISWLKQAETKVKGYNDKCEELTKDCGKITEMYKHLLDMKEREASVIELSCARISSTMATRQGYAMMTFTIVTVLFLPLSFFTSLFGMNVRDWTGDPDDSTLRRVMILMGSASAAIIVVALLAAFFPLWYGQASERARGLKSSNTKVSRASSRFGEFTNWWHTGKHDERAEEEITESEDEEED